MARGLAMGVSLLFVLAGLLGPCALSTLWLGSLPPGWVAQEVLTLPRAPGNALEGASAVSGGAATLANAGAAAADAVSAAQGGPASGTGARTGGPGHDEDVEIVLSLLDGFRRSSVLFAAVEFDVFSRLASSTTDADRTAAAIAQAVGAEQRSMELLLDNCAALGLLRKSFDTQAEGSTPESSGRATYAPTKVAGRFLSTTSPEHLTGYVTHSSRVLYKLWMHLSSAVLDGDHRWGPAFGFDSASDAFKALYSTDQAVAQFAESMASFGILAAKPVLTAFDLSSFRELVDVGGSTGYISLTAVGLYPELKATVFELDKVAALARARIAQSGMRSRVAVRVGSFREDALPEGDLVYLGRILHDWDDGTNQGLLEKVYDMLPCGGGLLLGEMLVDEERDGPSRALLQSLNMLVQTHGRERTAAEYTALLESVGFRQVAAQRTGSMLDAVLARKTC